MNGYRLATTRMLASHSRIYFMASRRPPSAAGRDLYSGVAGLGEG